MLINQFSIQIFHSTVVTLWRHLLFALGCSLLITAVGQTLSFYFFKSIEICLSWQLNRMPMSVSRVFIPCVRTKEMMAPAQTNSILPITSLFDTNHSRRYIMHTLSRANSLNHALSEVDRIKRKAQQCTGISLCCVYLNARTFCLFKL